MTGSRRIINKTALNKDLADLETMTMHLDTDITKLCRTTNQMQIGKREPIIKQFTLVDPNDLGKSAFCFTNYRDHYRRNNHSQANDYSTPIIKNNKKYARITRAKQ
jgi:hypothetical protein